MKLIIAGGRDFDNYKLLENEVTNFICEHGYGRDIHNPELLQIVVGGARGADSLGKEFAQRNLISYKLFKPDWDGLGKRAGFVRNQEMGDYATHLIVFWDGVSRGTKHMLDYATKKGLVVKVVKY